MTTTLIDRIANVGHSLTRSTTRANRALAQQAFSPRTAFYDLQDDYYDNEVYTSHETALERYKADRRLPKTIRPIHNPTKRIIDWWIDHQFNGVWTEDGLPDNGTPNMITYAPNTAEELRLATQQAFDWANADVMLEQWGHNGALYGNVLVEGRYSVGPGGEVYPSIVDPRWLVDIHLSPRLDVWEVRINVPSRDADGKAFVWGKLVTPEKIVTYYNDKPAPFDGNPAEIENPFGFVPFHWGFFRYQGGTFGRTAIDGLHGKIDEVNAVVSQVNDFMMKLPNQPVGISSSQPDKLKAMLDAMGTSGSSNGGDPNALSVLAMPDGAQVQAILQNWGIGETDPHIQRLIENYEKDVPEVTLSEKLLEMSQVTRPGSMPLVQDLQGKFTRVTSNTLNGIVKTAQHLMTMGGVLANGGLWGPTRDLTDAQRKFLPFRADSFDRGELSMALAVPSLVPPSFMERLEEAAAMEALRTPEAMRHAGLSDEQIYGEAVDAETVTRTRNGLLAEQDSAARSTAEASAVRFNSGVSANPFAGI
jgi:hypothetical protein